MGVILYCEGESSLNKIVCGALLKRFHGEHAPEIIGATSQEEALARLDGNLTELVLVIVPEELAEEEDGLDLVRKLRGLGYSGKVIYTGSRIEMKWHEDLGLILLGRGRKHYLHDLVNYVEQLLNGTK